MSIGVVGTKSGMTRVFNADGESIPVTVVHVEPNQVTQLKSVENDRYAAVQVAYGPANTKKVSRALQGHHQKAGVTPATGLLELRVDTPADDAEDEYAIGSSLGVEQFFPGQYVDVSGISKGKGYAGVIKRWNFKSQDATHGNSLSHRSAGSIGQCQTPGRVFKGKKMAGHLGNAKVTIQNLEVVRVDEQRNLLLIKGAIPGANGCDVVVRSSVKKGLQSPSTASEEEG